MTRLKFERVSQGLSLPGLAQLAGLHHPQISLFEQGRLLPTSQQLAALGRVLQVQPATVLLKEVTVREPEEEQARRETRA